MSPRWWRRRGADDGSDAGGGDGASSGAEHDVPCQRFVEQVTDYLEGALPADLVEDIDAHLVLCAGCRSVLDQFREVIRLTGRLADDDVAAVDPDVKGELLAAFRAAHR